jgi:hypothetical protein
VPAVDCLSRCGGIFSPSVAKKRLSALVPQLTLSYNPHLTRVESKDVGNAQIAVGDGCWCRVFQEGTAESIAKFENTFMSSATEVLTRLQHGNRRFASGFSTADAVTNQMRRSELERFLAS